MTDQTTTKIRLINVQTLGARCGTYNSHEEAEQALRNRGYSDSEFSRVGNTVEFAGGMNC